MNTRDIISTLVALTLTLLVGSCADNSMIDISVDKPSSIADKEYLNRYDALKTYVDHTKYPNFKLGAGAVVSDITASNVAARLTWANFDEITAGNCFKYSSVVSSDGTMDFTNVEKFIAQCDSNNVSVYGHTLCWHAQQQVSYLNELITDPNAVRHVLYVNTGEAQTNLWDRELYVNPSATLDSSKTYTLKMRAKASVDASITVWLQGDSTTQYWPTPSFSVSTEWEEISKSFEAQQAIRQIRFELGQFGGELWMDDVQLLDPDGNNLIANGTFEDDGIDGWTKPSYHDYTLKVVNDPDQQSNGEGMTEEMIKDTLTWAMGNFIRGMMNACEGKVKAWDVVNEPMSDSAPSELKSGDREGDTKNNFYWQDYLGKDYARVAIKLAREYGPSDIKLFINDYNLEAAYNNNAKCKGLIDMINYWESDGVTKIDGIGSQMHVTYAMNAETQAKNEEAYINMLNLLAATGKLIRISELDMGITDEDGNTIYTENVTDEQAAGMAEYYKFIVSKYLEIIPASQQYGICHWSPVDSPSDNSWRGGEPIGLWNLNYSRKPAYAGFVKGLTGK